MNSNWFHDIKVGNKLTAAFSVLILLTAMSTFSALYGTKRINFEVVQADNVNRIVKHIKDVRIAEKNFELRGDTKYLLEIDKLFATIEEIVLMVDQADIYDTVHMSEILKDSKEYRSALNDYVRYSNDIEDLTTGMRRAARETERVLLVIRQTHKEDLEQSFIDNRMDVSVQALNIADDANRLIKMMYEARQAEKNLVLSGNLDYAQENKAIVESMIELVGNNFSIYDNDVKQMLAFIEQYEKSFDEYISLASQLEETELVLLENARQVETTTDNLRSAAKEMLQQQSQKIVYTNISVASIALIFGCLISFFMSRTIVPPLNKVVKMINNIAEGKLNIGEKSTRKDELGQLQSAMVVMSERLSSMLGDISDNISVIASSSEELSSLTDVTSQGVSNQTKEIEQVATAMTEMSASAQEVSTKAELTLESANIANSEAQKGNELVSITAEGMVDLALTISESEKVIRTVREESENIISILDVIKNISEQTNLLALNAAIEAARAADHGRGFAVVADEVRSLAQKTQDSTVEIEKMIDNLNFSAQSAVDRMLESKAQVGVMVEKTEGVKYSLNSISQEINNIADMNAQVVQAVQEQGDVAEDVSSRTNTIQDVAQQTADSSMQTFEASKELARVGENLRLLSSVFQRNS